VDTKIPAEEVFHELARQRERRILEWHMRPDHIHVLIEIPPKYSVAQVVLNEALRSMDKK
jgi:REP element-mobilizing transposase RayT